MKTIKLIDAILSKFLILFQELKNDKDYFDRVLGSRKKLIRKAFQSSFFVPNNKSEPG